MITISQVADRIGEHICKKAGVESELNKICFGIEVIMVMSISIFAMIAVGGVLGMFWEALLVTFAAIIMKFIIGGPHLSGFFRCLVYSTILICGGAWFGSIYQLWLSTPVTLLLLLLDLLIILNVQLAPSYKTYTRSQTLVRKAVASSLPLISAIVFLEIPDSWSASALIGFTISILNISPMGTNLVRWLDQIIDQGGAGQ